VRFDRLRVDEESGRGERGVNVAQSVHDALERDASQGPATKREVETLTWRSERFGIVDREVDATTLLVGECRACGRDVLGARVEGVDGCGVRGRERG
jgi:hypothetical protein